MARYSFSRSYLLGMISPWRLCNTQCIFTLKTILIGYRPQNYVNKQWVLHNSHCQSISQQVRSRHQTWWPNPPPLGIRPGDLPPPHPPPDIRTGDLPLPNDIWWWSLETCLNLFIWGPTPLEWHLVEVTETGARTASKYTVSILLECCIWRKSTRSNISRIIIFWNLSWFLVCFVCLFFCSKSRSPLCGTGTQPFPPPKKNRVISVSARQKTILKYKAN